MPRVTIPVTELSDQGVADPTEQDGDTTNNHSLPNTGKTVFRVRNADAAAQTVTFVTPITVGGKAVDDTPISIPAGATRTFGKLSTALYGSSVPVDVTSVNLKLIAFEP
ncbi:hypothetical protein U9R90_06250 [Streptomyces sp. E11-3]|uniref:hypothetical protein n=1 Tax=Streptomyces sp. E11-3 TaxID=3110112 RepID=UPI00397F8709